MADQNAIHGRSLFVWGANSTCLGVTSNASLLPQAINLGHQVEKLACGLDFVAFATTRHHVYAFGSSAWAQSGGNEQINRIRFLQADGRGPDEVDYVQDISCGDQFCIVVGKGPSAESKGGHA